MAIPSSGVHSNGYSLIRKILNKKKINLNNNLSTYPNLKSELIKPTKIYVKEVVKLCKKKLINGCANITGGGLFDNLISNNSSISGEMDISGGSSFYQNTLDNLLLFPFL